MRSSPAEDHVDADEELLKLTLGDLPRAFDELVLVDSQDEGNVGRRISRQTRRGGR